MSARISDVAQFIVDTYHNQYNSYIDEMKLHKLLYLSLREELAISGNVLFFEPLEGWALGPVSREVREDYEKDIFRRKQGTGCVPGDDAYVVQSIVMQYGGWPSSKLAELTHKENSWLNSRKGLSDGERGHTPLLMEDIRVDASRIRPYDPFWDMYYDEFEDAENIEEYMP